VAPTGRSCTNYAYGAAKLPSTNTYDQQVRKLIAYFKPRGVKEAHFR
jgi:hypothetical protein